MHWYEMLTRKSFDEIKSECEKFVAFDCVFYFHPTEKKVYDTDQNFCIITKDEFIKLSDMIS